jgi:hypothetical protein
MLLSKHFYFGINAADRGSYWCLNWSQHKELKAASMGETATMDSDVFVIAVSLQQINN